MTLRAEHGQIYSRRRTVGTVHHPDKGPGREALHRGKVLRRDHHRTIISEEEV